MGRLSLVCRFTEDDEKLKNFQESGYDRYRRLGRADTLSRNVLGSSAANCHIVEIEARAARLHSGCVFVLVDIPSLTIFIWYGDNSNDTEVEYAGKFAETVNQRREDRGLSELEVLVLVEGEEIHAFWTALGGESEYVHVSGEESSDTVKHVPRLFHCSNAIGIFRVFEVTPFSQDDLHNDDVYILDGGRELFVWWGGNANEECKAQAMDVAKKYLAFTDDSHASRESIPITIANAGSEPIQFMTYFHGWNEEHAKEITESYQARLKALYLKQRDVVPSPMLTRKKK